MQCVMSAALKQLLARHGFGDPNVWLAAQALKRFRVPRFESDCTVG